ncbi:hypothetical protein FCU45_04120 [Sulfurimonas crateris]|uniref:Uncharacterized protein n=1 Tax=Sulfurimonas crateris TaxID=2574727 RepID=A0A4U2Z6I5_9BACT|nr:hypothetical protein [Sulfurimonas crateris]TKI69809.1 hypothetical protein FCU45_04120 [Sulfurimonas crateris]
MNNDLLVKFLPFFDSVWFWIIAIVISFFWGFVDIDYIDKEKNNFKTKANYFVSGFLSSILGWFSLYILFANVAKQEFDNFNIALLIVAVAGISGYGYKTSNWFGKDK